MCQGMVRWYRTSNRGGRSLVGNKPHVMKSVTLCPGPTYTRDCEPYAQVPLKLGLFFNVTIVRVLAVPPIQCPTLTPMYVSVACVLCLIRSHSPSLLQTVSIKPNSPSRLSAMMVSVSFCSPRPANCLSFVQTWLRM